MKLHHEQIQISTEVSTQIRFWRSDNDSAPALLVLPALGIPAGAYRRFCEAVQAQGAHVLSIDLRGVGDSSVRASRRCDWGYGDLVSGELNALLRYARERLPQAALHWFCHSMGGHLAVIHSIEQSRAGSTMVDGLILAASGSPQADLLAPKVRRQARFLVVVVRLMLATMGVFRGDWVGFGGRQPATLMREWTRFVRDGRMPMGDPRLPTVQAAPIRSLGLALDGDDYAPTAAVRALLARLGGEPKVEALVNPEGPRPGHTDWLKSPQAVAERVAVFLAEPASSAATDA